MVTINFCCCPDDGGGSYVCSGGGTVPGNIRVNVSGYEPCLSPVGCETDVLNYAPIANETYLLFRYYTSEPGQCLASDNCSACFALGNLTICDIASLYGESHCDPGLCANIECQTVNYQRGYKFIKTTTCPGGVTIDSYMGISVCMTFESAAASGTIYIYYVHVVMLSGSVTSIRHSFGIWNSYAVEFMNGAIDACVYPGGSFPCCDPEPLSPSVGCDGAGAINAGGSPGYSATIEPNCCGDMTITVGA